MFIKISGFGSPGSFVLPPTLRNPATNRSTLIVALVRWLSPHPNALRRDSEMRPMCPPPFDINHSLWTFTKTPRRRAAFRNDAHLQRQLNLFEGSDELEKRANAETLCRARYDLVQIESIDKFMNCTAIDNDNHTVLETVSLPFDRA